MIGIKQVGIAGVAIDGGINETIDNMIDRSLFLFTKGSPRGAMVKGSDILIKNFIDLPRKKICDSKTVDSSPSSASLWTQGTDVSQIYPEHQNAFMSHHLIAK
jgi:hypothetical protein